MTPQNIIVIVSGILESGGLAVFIYLVIKGLRNEIGSLKTTISAQKEAIIAIEKKAYETEKLSEVYRKFIRDMPGDIERYQEFLKVTKEGYIKELEKASKNKDEQIARLKEAQLQEIDIKEKMLSEIPALHKTLKDTVGELERRLDNILPTTFGPTGPAYSVPGGVLSSVISLYPIVGGFAPISPNIRLYGGEVGPSGPVAEELTKKDEDKS